MKCKYTRKAPKSSTVRGWAYELLPLDISDSIEKALEHRKSLGLPDDREERIERALRYQEFIRGGK